MNEIIKKTEDTKTSEATKKVKFQLLEAFALLVWLYLIVKIFVFDFDNYLIQKYFPSLFWVIQFKFFVIISTLSISWLLLRTKGLFKIIGFTVIYPFFLIFWRIPRILFKSKSWVGIFALIEILISFFKSFKLNFIIFTAVAISCLFILTSTTKYFLIPSMVILFAYLINHFIRRVKYAFRPFNIFSSNFEKLLVYWQKIQANLSVKAIQKYNDKQEINSKWVDNLQQTLILNKICYFLITKLRNFKQSSFAIIYSLVSLIITFFVTIIVFSFQNFVLFKINQNSFFQIPQGGLWAFFYYSFNAIFTNAINDFYPISNWARFFNSLEIFFGFLILVILLFLFTTIIREKQNEQIDTAIVVIQKQAITLENFIKEEFQFSAEEALKELEKMKGSMLKIIYFFMSQ